MIQVIAAFSECNKLESINWSNSYIFVRTDPDVKEVSVNTRMKSTDSWTNYSGIRITEYTNTHYHLYKIFVTMNSMLEIPVSDLEFHVTGKHCDHVITSDNYVLPKESGGILFNNNPHFSFVELFYDEDKLIIKTFIVADTKTIQPKSDIHILFTTDNWASKINYLTNYKPSMSISIDESNVISNPNKFGYEWRDDNITIPFKKTDTFNFQYVVRYTLPNKTDEWDNNNSNNYFVSCVNSSVDTKQNLEQMLNSLGEITPDITNDFTDIFNSLSNQPEMKDLMNMMKSLLK